MLRFLGGVLLLFGSGLVLLLAQAPEPTGPLILPKNPPPEVLSPMEAVPVPQDENYHQAFLAYKTGKYQEALETLNLTSAQPDAASLILLSKIEMELGKGADAEKRLHAEMKTRGTLVPALQQALGDVLLRLHRFSTATEAYRAAVPVIAETTSPDFILHLIYAEVGEGDLPAAQKHLLLLKPTGPSGSAYYFGKAAIDRGLGDSIAAEQDIQTSRTMQGIARTNDYFRTYLQVFAKSPEIAPAKK